MPSPEQPGTPHEGGRSEQQEHGHAPPYYRAARFRNERPAGKAYGKAQALIYKARETIDLSCYRFHLNKVWHVTVLGDPPPEELEKKLTQILATGEPATLPSEVLEQLARRRAEAQQLGPWVEGHYRPGERL